MLQILDELSNPVDFVEHFHNDRSIITLVSSGERVFIYENETKVGWYMLPKSFLQLAGQLVQLGEDLKKLEYAMPGFELSSISNILFVGNFVVGILNRTALVFFKNDFKECLLKGCIDNIEKLISKNFNISAVINDHNCVVYILLVSLHVGPNLHTLNKDLYLALFGLEALKSGNQILMLFLSDGHIWYILLNDTFALKYLYFLDNDCAKVYCDKTGESLTVCTKGLVSYTFSAENDTFRVEKSWNYSKNNCSSVTNFCNSANENHQLCSLRLSVEGKIVFKKNVQHLELNHEEQLHRLRTSLNDLEFEKQTFTALVDERFKELQMIETVATFSSTESNSVEFLLTPDALDACWVSDTLNFRPFIVLLSTKSISEAFYSNVKRLHIPVKTVLPYNNAVSFTFIDGLWLKCGSVCFDIIDFLIFKSDQAKNGYCFQYACELTLKKRIENQKKLLLKTLKIDTDIHTNDLVVQILNTLIYVCCDSESNPATIRLSCNSFSILNQFSQSLSVKLERICDNIVVFKTET